MKVEDIKLKLEDVMSPKRFIHSLNVMNVAMSLAKRFGEDVEKAAIAGLLHDYARDTKIDQIMNLCNKYGIVADEVCALQPELLHGPLGAKTAKYDFGIEDEMILNAIHYHTTGYGNMTKLDKIVYIADYIEPDRNFPGIAEIRELVFENINKAMLFALEKTIKYVMSKGLLIHPDTINARNHIILSINNEATNVSTNTSSGNRGNFRGSRNFGWNRR